jgi:hypothetical protein
MSEPGGAKETKGDDYEARVAEVERILHEIAM